MNNFKGKIFILVLTISLALGIKVFANEINFEKNEDTNLQKVILIDPGHGGSDGGARSNSGVQEKDINLQISLKLKKKLEERGYKSFLTRESDMELAPKKKDDLVYSFTVEDVTKDKSQCEYKDFRASLMVRDPNKESSPSWRGKLNIIYTLIA